MREEFYSIYRELDAEYSRQRLPLRLRLGLGFPLRDASIAVVNEAVSEALEEFAVIVRRDAVHFPRAGFPVSVRPDAVHFLRVNFHRMVAEPLFHREKRFGFGRFHQEELKEYLKHASVIV